MSAITAPADLEVAATPAATPSPKLLHPTSRAEEVSTGDPSRIIISTETKRLHPRGDSVPAGSPVSSTSEREPQAGPMPEPVSCPDGIPRNPALASIVSPRSAAIVSKKTTAHTVVKKLVADGKLKETGEGVKGNPHRYWKP